MNLATAWYTCAKWPLLLWPLEKLYVALARRRKQKALKTQWQPPVPLVVVGNISVGGTGKSPLVIYLARQLRSAGFRPAIVSRGYGAKVTRFPHRVLPTDTASLVGDEPLMIARRTGLPVVIDPDRSRACRYLLAQQACNLLLADDGLQHYAMGRDMEIVVVDGVRGLGNGHCLPAGPLREYPERLQRVDYVVINGTGGFQYPDAISMGLQPEQPVALDPSHQPILPKGRIHAVAGIGNPERFFNTLRGAGFEPIEHRFADHHAFTRQEITFDDTLPVIMTEKDAVKCAALNLPAGYYYLPVVAELETGWIDVLVQRLISIQESKIHGQKTA